jgi:uncharacterized protein (DUF1778 family)
MARTTAVARRERLEARITADQKALFQRAADLSGRSLTDFVVSSLQEAAEEVIRTHQVMKLSAEDTAVLMEALLNPPEPNENLRAAAARYRTFFNE